MGLFFCGILTSPDFCPAFPIPKKCNANSMATRMSWHYCHIPNQSHRPYLPCPQCHTAQRVTFLCFPPQSKWTFFLQCPDQSQLLPPPLPLPAHPLPKKCNAKSMVTRTSRHHCHPRYHAAHAYPPYAYRLCYMVFNIMFSRFHHVKLASSHPCKLPAHASTAHTQRNEQIVFLLVF